MKLQIPEDRLAHGIQIIGAKGTRKSSIVRRFVYQAYDRGWPVVFLDMARDYLPEFYRDGDHLIDFGDMRGVRWMTSREAIDEPHAMPIAEAAYPDKSHQHFFFNDHARAIFAYLVGVHHPTTSELALWFTRPAMLDSLLRGTEHAETMTKNSPEQRAGIIGTLNHLGRTLRWMPDKDGDREFSVTEWCQNRKGSIFLSSLPWSFPALRPLHSMIFDMLLLGVQSYPGRPVLFVGDEIGVFQRCPQLANAAATIRKSGAVVILAYQGYSQLEDTYGEKMADSISTNNYTHILLRTTSPRSAQYASDLLGKQEVERIRESRPAGAFHVAGRHQYSTERVMVPVVTSGEIQSLEDGRGYAAAGGMVTKIHASYLPPKQYAHRLIERIVAPQPALEVLPPEPAAPRMSRNARAKQTALPLSP